MQYTICIFSNIQCNVQYVYSVYGIYSDLLTFESELKLESRSTRRNNSIS